ncbi:MAG: hypothetical protein AAF487_03510 [Bacteroidota bacterium]
MLYIQAHKEHHHWLNYLMDEFRRIEGAEFQIGIGEKETESRLNLRYNSSEKSDVHLSIQDNPYPKFEWIENGLFILEGTQKRGKKNIDYDLFWNSFYFLSRRNEWLLEQSGKKVQSYSNKTGIKDEKIWQLPIVNMYFGILKSYIAKNFPELKFSENQRPTIELSHDLDYIKKTSSLRLKQSAFQVYNGIRRFHLKKIFSGLRFFFTSPIYWNFDFWKELEEKFGLKSVFYVYAKTNKRGLKEWLLDPAYDISTNEKLKTALKDLSQEGWRIGLHGSFNSADSFDLIQKEKAKLESAIHSPITKTRQHWLRYAEAKTPFFHEELFQEDSTLGWNDRIGFRAGIGSKFRPYNHKENRAFKHYVIPQVIMDSNIFDYGYGNEDVIIQQSKAMIIELAKQSNAHFSISWHPRTCHKEYAWQFAYEELLETWKTSISKY